MYLYHYNESLFLLFSINSIYLVLFIFVEKEIKNEHKNKDKKQEKNNNMYFHLHCGVGGRGGGQYSLIIRELESNSQGPRTVPETFYLST